MIPIGAVRAAVAASAVAATISGALAREPGIAPNMPPGLTLGVPIAAILAPDWYLTNRLSYSDSTLRNDSGGYNGQDSTIVAESIQLTWVPDVKLVGATYKAFVLVPVIDLRTTRTTTATGALGSWHSTGLANPKVQPLDLSWNLSRGWFAVTGLGFYPPLGRYRYGAPLNIAGNFWTLEPSAGVTYLQGGLHFSAHLIYNINTRNTANQYLSGDQAFLNLTLTESFGGWKLGPAAYYQRQFTPDSNRGGRASFGGRVFPEPRQIGAGLLATTDCGKFRLTAILTRDVEARNTLAGTKFSFNLFRPF
jgi:hypothetical protein